MRAVAGAALEAQHSEMTGECFSLDGFPNDACNGLYRQQASGDFVNDAGYHVFFARQIGEWVVKAETFEPDCRSATAIADWGRVALPRPGTNSWRWWACGWEDIQVTVAAGSAASLSSASAEATTVTVDPQCTKPPANFRELSREIVMLVMRLSQTQRDRRAMACVCKGWRDAARERIRRPSIMVGAVMSQSSLSSWTARRMAAAPHSFG